MGMSRVIIAFSAAGTVACSVFLVKDHISGKIFDETIKADNKIAIVTGANTGIGKETVRILANRGAKVYMACRDMAKCEEARETIVLTSKNRYIYCRPCDLSSFESVKKFVDIFKSEQSQLDILIDNAGVMRCPQTATAEGIELQLGVNHMGHFLLTNLLLDELKKSEEGRVVVVSSVAHLRGTINKEDLNSTKDYDPRKAYDQSKLANMLFVNELATRLLGSNVTVNGVHPGLVDTEIARHMPVTKSFASYLLYPMAWPFIKTPFYGAQTSVYAALDPSLKGVTGQYISDMKIANMSDDAKNVELAQWMWAVSEKWTRLDEKPATNSTQQIKS